MCSLIIVSVASFLVDTVSLSSSLSSHSETSFMSPKQQHINNAFMPPRKVSSGDSSAHAKEETFKFS